MPRDYDSDRPKKSWREIDKGKDRSAHRKEERPAMSPFKQARADSASKVYKSKLDSFFDGDGKAPAGIRDKLEALSDASPEGARRKEAVKRIKDAGTSSARDGAVAEFLREWELPPDHEVLVEVLSCSNEEYVATAIGKIEELLDANRPPRRTPLMEQRLKRIVSMSEEEQVRDHAAAVLKKLRLFS